MDEKLRIKTGELLTNTNYIKSYNCHLKNNNTQIIAIQLDMRISLVILKKGKILV